MPDRDETILGGILSLAGGTASILVGWVGSWGESLGIIGVSPVGDFLIRFAFPPFFVLVGLFLLLSAAIRR